jgi:hypothetical protein
MRRGWCAGLALAALAGCAAPGGRSKETFQWRADVKPGVYFPLEAGTAWSYEVVDAATGEKLLLVNRVEAREGNRATLANGADPLAYEDRGDALVRLPSGTVVLRAPVAAGESWDIPGGKARITSVDARVAASNQVFSACVVIEESTDERRVVTTYAPHVGPVLVEIYARGPAGERLDRRGMLRSYHRAGDTLLAR